MVQVNNDRAATSQSRERPGRRGRMRNLASRATVFRLVTVGAGALAAGAAMSVPAFAATSPTPSAVAVPPAAISVPPAAVAVPPAARPVTTAAAAASSASSATFNIFNPPSQSGAPSGSPEGLTGVYAASPTDVWAVGGATGDPFEHWNGTTWTGQGLPAGLCTEANNQCGVSSITGTSADNITAEGGAIIDTGTTEVAESVAFHFNGTSWSQMTIPANVTLGPLAAFSATDLWSVNNNGDAEQFNGSTWTTTKLPISTTLPDLSMSSISGSSPSDIWAAGTASTEGVEHRKVAPVLEHFNGTSWTNVTVPVNGGVSDVAAISPTDAFALDGGSLIQWNGSTWSVVTATTQTGAAVSGSALAALSPTDVWLAGVTTLDNFNGTTWTSIPVPSTAALTPAGQMLAEPVAATAAGPGTVWFVGEAITATGGELPYAMGTSNG
jgi:hypothetical protein